jgi:nucleotide-binding universal stress UspA family protein
MFTKILVPLDGSELSDRILSFVRRVPQRKSLQLVLLRVLRQVDPKEASACKEEFHDALVHMFEVEAQLRSEGTQATSIITQGAYAAEQILRVADLINPTLLAVSTHGRGGKLTTLRGGVAERLVRECPIPLFLGSSNSLPLDPGKGFAKILVPLDGSQVSARVLNAVEPLALDHGSEVILFTADPTGALGADVEATLAPYQERLKAAGIERVRVSSATGDEATQILDAVSREGADLLAMTSHSRSDHSGITFGSVAEQVVNRCGSPLLLQRIPAPK